MRPWSHAFACCLLAGGGVASAADPVPLTLNEAIFQTLEHNPEVQVREFDMQIVYLEVDIRRASFDPVLWVQLPQGLTGQQSTTSSLLQGAEVLESSGVGAAVGVGQTFDWGTRVDLEYSLSRSTTNSRYVTYNPQIGARLGLSVTQPLLRDRGRKAGRAAVIVATNEAEASLDSWSVQLQEIVYTTVVAYWELAFRIRDLEVKEQALTLAQQQLDRNAEQVRLGALAPVETIQAEQAVASADYQRIQASLALSQARDRLAAQLDAPRSVGGWDVELVPSDAPREQLPPVNLDAEVEAALARNPRVRVAAAELENRAVEVGFQQNQRLPRLDLAGGVELLGVGGAVVEEEALARLAEEGDVGAAEVMGQLLTADNYAWTVGLTLSMPLMNRAAAARLSQAQVRERQAEAALAQARQRVEAETRQAVHLLENRVIAAEAARRARVLAERQLAVEEQKFAVGSTSNFQVLTLQRQLAEARTQELRALIDLELADADLRRIRGDLVGVGRALAGAAGVLASPQ